MTTREYVYKITEVVKVTDGDTYWLRVDVGFRETVLVNVRLLGYDCPEMNRGSAFEKAEAKRARELATAWLHAPVLPTDTYWIRTEKDPDDFGRWLGEVWCEDPYGEKDHLGQRLRDAELASVWPTRWRDEFDKGDA